MGNSKKQSVSYDKGQEVLVRNKPRKIQGGFSAIGRLSTVHNRFSEDVFDRLDKVSKGAISLFVQFKRHRDDNNNLVPYPTKEWDKTKKETFSRHLRELRDIGLVKVAQRTMKGKEHNRPYVTARQTYMIDPQALKCWHFEDATLLWEQCKS